MAIGYWLLAIEAKIANNLAIKPIAAMMCPEAMFIRFRIEEVKSLANVGTVLVGPGLGQADSDLFNQPNFLQKPASDIGERLLLTAHFVIQVLHGVVGEVRGQHI